jgi:hypothetical protein
LPTFDTTARHGGGGGKNEEEENEEEEEELEIQHQSCWVKVRTTTNNNTRRQSKYLLDRVGLARTRVFRCCVCVCAGESVSPIRTLQ